jgi:hypothetical protein
MTRRRFSLISLQDTPWCHVVSRCVRRAFLCGDDAHSGQNFDHRRQWMVDWILRLSALIEGVAGDSSISLRCIEATRLDIDTDTFIEHASRFLKEFGHAIGRPESMVAHAAKRQTKYLRGIKTVRAMCCQRQAA